jgi:hypothetical protein
LTEKDFERLPFKHFSPWEAWGDLPKIEFSLIEELDKWREFIGVPFYITFGTNGKHVTDNHKNGVAVDGCIDADLVCPIDAFICATRFNFNGIGLYPKARHPACKKPLGMHFDIATVEGNPGRKRFWIGEIQSGSWTWHPVNSFWLKRYGLF